MDPEGNQDLVMNTAKLGEELTRVPASELSRNFIYTAKDAPTFPRATDDEAMTKRRRIELSEASAVGHPAIERIAEGHRLGE